MTIEVAGTQERIAIGAKTSTTVEEVLGLVSSFMMIPPEHLKLKAATGNRLKLLAPTDEVASYVILEGVKSFQRPKRQYQHPILVIGGGLGGIQSCIRLLENGYTDFVMMEKLRDFGGASWMVIANKFTKLQTEKGTFHVNYIKPDQEVPTHIGDMEYKTWPSRDQILTMMRAGAAEHGLYEHAKWGTTMEKVSVRGTGLHDRSYMVTTIPVDEKQGDGELIFAGAVIAWPGNLCFPRRIEFPGEDEFEGYIEYGSIDKVDYTEAEGKSVVLYGHGAFTIENVRTLVEHRCKKVWVMCRKRNLCGMKMVSWLVGQAQMPIPGHIMLNAFQKIYDLVGFDVWSAHSVKTDEAHSYAHIEAKTVFGVTDVYFLAGYFGLMEVVVDEIKRLSYHTASTKKGKKIECEMIVKAVGTIPDFKIDKQLGLKEMVGMWVNGDPLRPVNCNGMYVAARNFGSFSSGPGFAPNSAVVQWFIEHPEDMDIMRSALPINKPGERPGYVPDARHGLPMGTAYNMVPGLSDRVNGVNDLKWRKQQQAHPLPQYLALCVAEWEMYCKFFRDNKMVDDRPDPTYPYTEEFMKQAIQESYAAFSKARGWS